MSDSRKGEYPNCRELQHARLSVASGLIRDDRLEGESRAMVAAQKASGRGAPGIGTRLRR